MIGITTKGISEDGREAHPSIVSQAAADFLSPTPTLTRSRSLSDNRDAREATSPTTPTNSHPTSKRNTSRERVSSSTSSQPSRPASISDVRPTRTFTPFEDALGPLPSG